MDAILQAQFFQMVLIALAIAVGVSGAAYLLKLWELRQTQVSQEKWTLFNWIVARAVIGVEQLWRTKLIEKDERLPEAVKIVQRELDEWGIRGINIQRITDACIAGVGTELNKARLIAEKVPAPTLPDIPIGL